MATEFAKNFSIGSGFGAALTLSGVFRPEVIIAQMRFEDFHMMKVFLTASACSAGAFAIADRTGVMPNKPKPPASYGWIGPYDGNVLGGALIGIGMTLTGACPGTVLVQAATGVHSGQYVFAGSVTGGILWAYLSNYLKKAPVSDNQVLTLTKRYDWSVRDALILYEVGCLTVIGLASQFGPEAFTSLTPPMLGGIMIGVIQALSVIGRKQPIGVSTGYEELGQQVQSFFQGFLRKLQGKSDQKGKNLSTTSMVFGAGILAGSWAIAQAFPEIARTTGMPISATRAFLGGAVMTFGARLAGGCTSGHGISGMSMFAISSTISVISMFAGGMGLAALMR